MKSRSLLSLVLFTLLFSDGCSRGPKTATIQDPTPSSSALKVTTGPRFTTIRVDVRTAHLELFLRDDAGHTFHRFDRLKTWLAAKNRRLLFAMNAGMFKPDFSAVGLLVQDAQQVSPLNLADGAGNFFLKPNGVFFVSESGPRIVDSTEYPALAQGVSLATQSGPLLVRNGKLHPGIDAASTARLIRNGVGVSGDSVMFVISEQPVSFYELATYFRDELHCPDALYLDGVVSSLYSLELQRNDAKVDLGPIVAVVQ